MKYCQAPANHLVSASFMSAPAALAMAKLFYPETRENRRKNDVVEKIPRCVHFLKFKYIIDYFQSLVT